MAKPNILVILAHPDLENSRVNRRLAEVAETVENATMHDLYAHYPDFKVNREREQALLLEADLIVFQFPLFWYSTPALLKQWQDSVLHYGFAFGQEGTALHGKSFMLAVSSGGPAVAYRAGSGSNYGMDELLRPLQQMATLCGMRYLPAFLTQGTGQLADDELDAYAAAFGEVLGTWSPPTAD